MRRSIVTEIRARGLKLHVNCQPSSQGWQGSPYVTVTLGTRVVIWSFDEILKLILDYTENKNLLCFPDTKYILSCEKT